MDDTTICCNVTYNDNGEINDNVIDRQLEQLDDIGNSNIQEATPVRNLKWFYKYISNIIYNQTKHIKVLLISILVWK